MPKRRATLCTPCQAGVEDGEGAHHLVGIVQQGTELLAVGLVLLGLTLGLLEEGAQLAHLLGEVVVDGFQ